MGTHLPPMFRGPWRTYVDHDCGASIEAVDSGAPVLFVGFTLKQEPDLAVAEHLCELHNAWELEQVHQTGQGILALDATTSPAAAPA